MTSRSLRAAAAHPRSTAWWLRGAVRPEGLVARYGRLARRAKFDRVWFVLSFDCDTPEDAAVAWEVHQRLDELGVRPVYAVPGALLRDAADVYRRIAATGAEFLNHGGRMHTRFDEGRGRWESCFFYDEQTREDLRKDVLDGHRAVEEVIGQHPRGFRTPHFGTFQRPAQLRWLHGLLAEEGYRYSSSTTPIWGFRHGPAFDRFGLVELPVTGGAGSPLSILDTWGAFEAPDRVRDERDYERDAGEVAAAHSRAGAGVINVYGDPSHVHGSEEFFRAVEEWRRCAEPIGYSDLLDALGR